MDTRRLALRLSIPIAALMMWACGDDDSGNGSRQSEATAAAVTAQDAIREIGAVRAGLKEGLTSYRDGDATRAGDLVAGAYLEHFELVEAPLGKRDEELNEELEELIRETLRGAIRDGAPTAQVAALVGKAQRELGQAERVLAR